MTPILHFSHANGFPASTYAVMLDKLGEHFDVRSIDKLGHNPQYPVTDNWPHLLSELEAYFDAHYSEPVFAVGHSLGGKLSMALALKRPELVRAVVILDAPAMPWWQASMFSLVKRMGLADYLTPARRTEGRRAHWQSTDEALAYFQQKSLMRNFHPQCLSDYATTATEPAANGGVTLRFDPTIEMSIYRTIPSVYRSSTMPVPTTVIAGRESNVFKAYNARHMQHTMGMSVQWVDGSHMFPLEKPLESAAWIQHALLG